MTDAYLHDDALAALHALAIQSKTSRNTLEARLLQLRQLNEGRSAHSLPLNPQAFAETALRE